MEKSVQKYYYYVVQKYCLFGLRAEILLARSLGSWSPVQGHFWGV